MAQEKYKRKFDELRARASLFWPSEISQKEGELSIIPILVKTQDDFIAILGVPTEGVDSLFSVIDNSSVPANLFLKHLVVLSDFGGEPLQRMNATFGELYPTGRLDYVWKEREWSYEFKSLPVSGLDNAKLGINGKKLFEKQSLTDLHKDVIAVLLFGALSISDEASGFLQKCEIGNYLGELKKLEKFIKERYIWVSRITGGSQAATLGDLAEAFVIKSLHAAFEGESVQIKPRGSLHGVTQTENERPTVFDIVVSKPDANKYVAIEVSFQMTTNSTIERKAGQAKARFEQIEKSGFRIAYVIDGAGNFERANAITTLCSYSHCTVGFSAAELEVLGDFLREYFNS